MIQFFFFLLKTWTISDTLKFAYTIKLKLKQRDQTKLSYSSEFVQEPEASNCTADRVVLLQRQRWYRRESVSVSDDGWQTGISVALSGDENGRLDNSDAPTEIKGAGSEIDWTGPRFLALLTSTEAFLTDRPVKRKGTELWTSAWSIALAVSDVVFRADDWNCWPGTSNVIYCHAQ